MMIGEGQLQSVRSCDCLGAVILLPTECSLYDDSLIGCLPNNKTKHAETTGLFTSNVCGAGSNSDCDMATNVAACACQGTDPTAGDWEGTICGSDPQARCSDGDVNRDKHGYGAALCTSIDTSLSPPQPSGGRCGNTNRFPGLAGSPSYGVENVAKRGTPQRRPGTSLSLPTTVIRQVDTTAHWAFDQYEDPNIAFANYNIRKVKMFGNITTKTKK